MKKFNRIAVGGTFDKLHRGHKTLLDKAFEIGDKVIIGLSSDDFVLKMNKPHETAQYSERRKELEAYLEELGLMKRAEIVILNDSYGLTLSDKDLQILVVSEETLKAAEKINEKRKELSLPKLVIISVSMVPAENNTPISTTRIRYGEIDRNGHLLK